MFLEWPSTKIAKMVLLGWTKWPPGLKIEKKKKKKLLEDISQANGPISKYFHRNVPLMPLYQNCLNGSAPLNKWPPERKIEKPLNNISS